MYSGHMISLKEILWRVFNNPSAIDLNPEDAAEYAIEAIKLIGAPLSYVDKVSNPIELINYKAALPDNLINIRGVKLLGANNVQDIALTRATDLYHTSIACNDSGPNPIDTTTTTSPYADENVGVNSGVINSSTSEVADTFHEYTYTAQCGIIQTSMREGTLEISYKSLAVDDEGYPMIPDNQKVKLALEYYILFRFLEPLWMSGKITDKAFEYITQKRYFYMASANTDMQLQSGDHLESVMNAVNRLIVNDNAFNDFYKGTGKKERIKKYY